MDVDISKAIEEAIQDNLNQMNNELYAFSDAVGLKQYLKEKFSKQTMKKMVRVLTGEIEDELDDKEGELAKLKESLESIKTGFKLLIPEPSTLSWNYDQLPERLSPHEKNLAVYAYNDLMGI